VLDLFVLSGADLTFAPTVGRVLAPVVLRPVILSVGLRAGVAFFAARGLSTDVFFVVTSFFGLTLLFVTVGFFVAAMYPPPFLPVSDARRLKTISF
ncbi:MAG: hypothetical protein NUV50_02255, partial [Rhodospirillales bacterium]|nr:hypothetical protein [Rhodospirillales bacterium]